MHTAEFVDSFTRGVLDEPRMKRIGFGEVTRSPVLIERTLSEVAGELWDKLSHNRIKSGDRTLTAHMVAALPACFLSAYLVHRKCRMIFGASASVP